MAGGGVQSDGVGADGEAHVAMQAEEPPPSRPPTYSDCELFIRMYGEEHHPSPSFAATKETMKGKASVFVVAGQAVSWRVNARARGGAGTSPGIIRGADGERRMLVDTLLEIVKEGRGHVRRPWRGR